MRILLFISILMTMLFGFSSASISQEKIGVDPIAELEAVSNYFHDIDIGQFDCDIKTIFDMSRQYDKDDIEKWDLAKGTYVFLGNYHYEEGGKFYLDVFGERVAQNDASTDVVSQSIVVPMLPLPGGIMFSKSIMQRYTATYNGDAVIDGNDCSLIRLSAIKKENEFFSFMEYYIDKKFKVIRKVECAFDYGGWTGNGIGEFYYKKKLGKLLPNIGYGNICMNSPYSRNMTLWGKWSGFKVKSLKDVAENKTEPASEPKTEEKSSTEQNPKQPF